MSHLLRATLITLLFVAAALLARIALQAASVSIDRIPVLLIAGFMLSATMFFVWTLMTEGRTGGRGSKSS